jgi:hypothetical protein
MSKIEDSELSNSLFSLRLLRQLQEENSKLKQIVADLSLDKQMLQDVLKKSFEGGPKEKAGRGSSAGLQSVGGPMKTR